MSIRVRLRDVRRDDLPTLFEHQMDPEANRMANFPARDRNAFMTHWAKILADETLVAKTVVHGDAIAGNVVSWTHDGERDVGYWIGREHWGKGVATAALGALLAELQERPLFAHVAEHNVGSIRVLEKCGFSNVGSVVLPNEEGTEFLYRLGDPQDSASIA
jgi:RimJ/RimL family protein N-acetyltransferase